MKDVIDHEARVEEADDFPASSVHSQADDHAFAVIEYSAEDLEPRPFKAPPRGRVILVLGVIAAFLILLLVPPLVNMNRFRRQIASSIGASLGRPVHMDSVTLNMLPLPGFTLENFVVTEDPAFGSEPVIRANSVRATLRVSSLWRRRVEFSRISLDETSVNLVHRADGQWNVESILLQAARMRAAPTPQKDVGDSPRFPYIEASSARVNVKMGVEKMPLSLTEATFALWLPEPEQWRLRLQGHPTRTDTAATDTGVVRVEGTLGRASLLADVPVHLQARWTAAPLGAVSWVLVGHDAGWRGEMTLDASVEGTAGDNVVESRLQLDRVRRADFVPLRTLNADIRCKTKATELFHRLAELQCSWPGDAQGQGLSVQGIVPSVLQPESAVVAARVTDVDLASLLDGLRLVSARVSPALLAEGRATGEFMCCSLPGTGGGASSLTTTGATTFRVSGAKLSLSGEKAFVDGAITGTFQGQTLEMQPLALALGGSVPAMLQAHADSTGYQFHLSGTALRSRLLALATALPQFGDGLPEALPVRADGTAEAPERLDLVSTRTWAGGQVWKPAESAKPPSKRRRRRGHV